MNFKNNYLVLLSIFLSFLLSSCERKSNSSKQEGKGKNIFSGVELVQIDSIMIDLIGNLKIFEYNSETGYFLGGDISGAVQTMIPGGPKMNEIGHVIIDHEGTIINQFNHTNDGPEGHGEGALDNFFIGDSSIGVLSKMGLYQYQLDGSFVKKYKELNTLGFIGFSDFKVTAANADGILAIGLAKVPAAAFKAQDSLFRIVKPFHFYDLTKFESGYEKLEGLAIAKYGYPDHWVYSPNSKYLVLQLPPRVAFNRKTNEALVMYPEVPYMEVYSMETGSLKTVVDLQPEHFGEYIEMEYVSDSEYYRWLDKGGWTANSYYQDLIQLGEYTLLRYNVPLPFDEVKSLVEGYGYRDEKWQTIRKKNYRFYYQLFKDGKKVVPDFSLPEFEPQPGQSEFLRHDRTRGKLIGGDGVDRVYVFIPNDGEEERDYELIRVFQLKLK